MLSLNRKCMLRSIILLCSLFLHTLVSYADGYKLSSPDGRLQVNINVSKDIQWSIVYNNITVIEPSSISLKLIGTDFNTDLKITKVLRKSIDEKRRAQFYKRSEILSQYKEIEFKFKNGYGLQVRAYNKGVAYRFINTNRKVFLSNECAEFVFSNDFNCLAPYVCDLRDNDQFCSAFESLYSEVPLSKLEKDTLCLSPMMVCLDCGIKAVICESGLYNFPGMFLKRNSQKKYTLEAAFAECPQTFYVGGFNDLNEMPERRADYIAELTPKQELPWRIVMISDKDSDFLDSDLVYDMGGKCMIEDTSWIKPGKATWDWWNNWNITGVDFRSGCNTQTYKYYVDFAAKYGLEYIVIDEGWSINAKNAEKLNPELDLKELISYAKNKNIGIILWATYLGLKDKEDYYFSYYSQMGIKGFKVDFFDRDDQRMVDYCYKLAKKAADYHLVLDLHGMFKPSGLNVCYPNVLSFEGVRGLENCKWHNYDMPRYDVTMPFLRMQAGPIDYTPGAMYNASKSLFKPVSQQPMSMGTRVHQIASYIVFDSPLQMLCDSPTLYEQNIECTKFISDIPTCFDKYYPLDSQIGNYVSVAKSYKDNWFVGALTNWDSRQLTIDFSFLPEGSYEAIIFEDGINSDKNASDYKTYKIIVDSSVVKTFTLASGGGLAMKLTKL